MDAYQLKITLKNIHSPIWRRVQVRADIKLGKLHRVIQDTMDWTNRCMHQFIVGRDMYGTPVFGGELDFKDEHTVSLSSLVSEGGWMVYECDFGDSREHELLIEKALPIEPSVHYPRCLAGKRACPPEDCGGVWGYANLLEILANPKHKEYAEMLEWSGGGFDPEAFDLDGVNEWLRKLH